MKFCEERGKHDLDLEAVDGLNIQVNKVAKNRKNHKSRRRK